MSAAGFAAQIDREFDAAMDDWNRIIRKIALTALTRIVQRTPVDTGRARANWFVQIGGSGFDVSTDTDKSGSVTISQGSQAIARYDVTDGAPVISIYNNLPYINALEHGHSKQAPTGMVAITVTELEAGL